MPISSVVLRAALVLFSTEQAGAEVPWCEIKQSAGLDRQSVSASVFTQPTRQLAERCAVPTGGQLG
jgi:hypothetical protein